MSELYNKKPVIAQNISDIWLIGYMKIIRVFYKMNN